MYVTTMDVSVLLSSVYPDSFRHFLASKTNWSKLTFVPDVLNSVELY